VRRVARVSRVINLLYRLLGYTSFFTDHNDSRGSALLYRHRGTLQAVNFLEVLVL